MLLNDTTYWYHWGCTGTSTAIAEMLERRGYAVGRVPITALQHCTGGPDSPEAFDDPAVFERFAAANPWLIRELAPAEVVVMNGEGSLHGFNPFVSNLLYVAFVASVRLGKRVQILNHSCYPDESAEAGDSPAWRIYRKVYGALERAVIREPRSFALLERAGFRVERGGDCLPLWIRDHFEPERWPRRGGVVVAGSVAAAAATAEAYGALIAGLARRGVPVRALIGANMFPAAEEEEFLAAVAARAAGALEVVRAASLDEWLGVVAGADLVVSGRFHHTMAAAALGTPYVLLGSNTPKNAGLAEMLRTPAPFAPGGDGLAGSLAAAVEAALGSRPAPAARDTLARELCELATRNFDGLPALAG